MKKVIIMFALAMGIVTANAQENVTVGENNGSEQPTLTKEVYPQKEATAIYDWIVYDVRNNPDLDDAQKAAALDFDLTVISGVTIPCYGFIEREFSEVYFAQNKPE